MGKRIDIVPQKSNTFSYVAIQVYNGKAPNP